MSIENILREAYHKPGVTNTVNSLYNVVKGKGITRKHVTEFLENERTFQLQKRKPKDIYGGTVIPLDKGTYELDLADMSNISRLNNGITFLLVLVDSLTKYAHVLPLKNKSASKVNEVLLEFIRKHKPKGFVSDPGSEFTNNTFKALLRDENIPIRYVRVGSHAPNAERFIQNLKNMIYSYMERKGESKYIEVLDDFVKTYNNNQNSRLRMSPKEMESQPKLARLVQKVWAKIHFKRFPVIPIGTKVRKQIDKETFTKGYTNKWSQKVYTITEMRPGGEYTHDRYYINDDGNRWYRAFELQVIKGNTRDEDLPEPVRRTRDQREVARELRELHGETIGRKLRSEKEEVARRPKGTFSHVEIPGRKRTKK